MDESRNAVSWHPKRVAFSLLVVVVVALVAFIAGRKTFARFGTVDWVASVLGVVLILASLGRWSHGGGRRPGYGERGTPGGRTTGGPRR
jgi:hypothetical protein